jgi:hypothetical protein
MPAQAFHASTRHSLQARVLVVARRARAAIRDCGLDTRDANAGSCASNPGARRFTRPAPAPGYPGSPDRRAVGFLGSLRAGME